MKYCILTIALAFTLTLAFSQDKILLKEDFKNNKNAWHLQKDSNFLVEINKGVLHLQKFEKNRIKNGCLWYNKIIPGLNTLKDFSITIYARYLSGGDIFEMIDFQWGTRDKTIAGSNTSLYQFNFFLNGEVRLDYFNKRWNYFVKKDVKLLINHHSFKPGVLNKYEIVQKAGFTTFSINGNEYFKQPYNPIAGNSIGFQQCLKSAWEIDKIIVKQLGETVATPVVTDTTNYSSDKIANSSPAVENVLKVYPNPFINDINVSFTLEKEETVQVYFIDMSGAILQQHTKKIPAGPQRFPLYAEVPAGSYIIKLQFANGKTLTATVVKQ